MSIAKSRIVLGLVLCFCLVGSTFEDLDNPYFWLGTLLLSLLLLLSIWRGRLKSRRLAFLEAGAAHFQVSTECFLDWESLAVDLDQECRRLLMSLMNIGRQDGRALRPSLEKAARRLKRLCRRRPECPGPWAYRSWCLALLDRIAAREALLLESDERAGKLWDLAGCCRTRALKLAPCELKASIITDWARTLEEGAEEGDNTPPGAFLEKALAKYREAVALDPEQALAWRGQGRVVSFLALTPDRPPRLSELEKAVELYETAWRGREWDGAFYDEFGLAVLRLAENHHLRAIHFYRYAAKLFIMASEIKGQSANSLFMAGKCLHLAGLSAQDDSRDTAAALHQEALAPLKEAAEADPDDHWSFLWAARCFLALYHLAESDRESREKFLREGLDLCSKAALASPVEEVYSEWANILSILAEQGGPDSSRLWEEAAEKYGQAVTCDGLATDRAAVNWHNWGYAMAGLAATMPTAVERRRVLMEAAVKYKQAARLNSDNLITLKNWGDILGELAEMSSETGEAGRYYEEADVVFGRATKLYPDKAGPWRRWGVTLQSRAQGERNPARRRELWDDCLAKLNSGVEADPQNARTWIILGQALSARYWESPEHERALLVDDIIDKYKEAASIEPDDHEIRSLLGRARLEASELPADLPGGGGALSYVRQAVADFKAASRLNPECSGYWSDWGRALFRLSQLTENEASALATLAEAREKYETALALDPLSSDHHTGLGHVLYHWGWRLQEPSLKREKFKAAYEHCAEAGNLAPHDPTVWRNWAKVAEALANVEKDPRKSYDWQNEANEKSYYADTLDTGHLKDRRH